LNFCGEATGQVIRRCSFAAAAGARIVKGAVYWPVGFLPLLFYLFPCTCVRAHKSLKTKATTEQRSVVALQTDALVVCVILVESPDDHALV
jgi:hypothetical protein